VLEGKNKFYLTPTMMNKTLTGNKNPIAFCRKMKEFISISQMTYIYAAQLTNVFIRN
jgi:hypothetical protein